MTWGPLGMTLASGEIQEILKASYEVAREEIDGVLSSIERTLYRNLSNATMETGDDLSFSAIEGMIDKIANIAKVRHTFDVVADMVLSRWKADRTLRNSAFYGRNDFVAESYGFRDKAIYSVERAPAQRNEETETLSIEGLELGN